MGEGGGGGLLSVDTCLFSSFLHVLSSPFPQEGGIRFGGPLCPLVALRLLRHSGRGIFWKILQLPRICVTSSQKTDNRCQNAPRRCTPKSRPPRKFFHSEKLSGLFGYKSAENRLQITEGYLFIGSGAQHPKSLFLSSCKRMRCRTFHHPKRRIVFLEKKLVAMGQWSGRPPRMGYIVSKK